MMTETPQTHSTHSSPIPFGARLQAAREALGLESKDIATQLRLNEKIIRLMEADFYSSDLPPTFLRGYIRAYGKLLQIPEDEIKQAIEPIQPKAVQQSVVIPPKPIFSVTSSHYFVQLFTYLIVFTLIGLVGAWWHTHSTPSPVLAEKQINLPIDTLKSALTIPSDVKTNAVAASVNLGAKLSEHRESATALPLPLTTHTAAHNIGVPASKINGPIVANTDDQEADAAETNKNETE